MVDEIIALKQVSWRRNGRTILDGISWRVKPGEHWVIIGLNGSGKTSLLNLVTGYEWPSKGEISLLGHPLGRVELRLLRRQIGWVSAALQERYRSQEELSAREVVLSGRFGSIGLWDEVRPEDREEADHLLAQFRIEHRADTPFCLLSSGERQRVLLARAWMAQPQLIILDEPCSGLDIKAREELLATIEELGSRKGPTMIYVTHHIEEVMPCFTHALLLKGGTIVAQGPKGEVLAADKLSATFDLAVTVEWHDGRPWIKTGNASIQVSP